MTVRPRLYIGHGGSLDVDVSFGLAARWGPALAVVLGLDPIITSQYSSTTVYQVSYHIQSLVF